MSMNKMASSHGVNSNMAQKKVNKKAVIGRLLSYLKDYKWQLALVGLAIIVSAVAGVAGSLFLKVLIDDFITPLIGQVSPSFAKLSSVILFMGGIYLLGVVGTYAYNRLMTSVSQSGLDKIRRDMFAKMQKLPLSYFDTNAHGDIMSKYTNDIDTLRELLSQVLPQVFSTIVTLALVFSAMVATSWELTILVIASVVLMLVVIAYLAKKSGKYYLAQQNSLGEVNGYIEEMMNGQKVVKVFCHEEKTKEGFDELNQKLAKNSAAANGIASIFMPVMNNLGNVQYVLIALVGGMLAINGVGGGHITLGVIAAFLQLSKSFTNPIIQVAQQLNFLVMAFAGADRIFEMMDEKPEQ
ncbi:MAG: ABC transporter ATP-binding protein, partial [Clostridia bacterium]